MSDEFEGERVVIPEQVTAEQIAQACRILGLRPETLVSITFGPHYLTVITPWRLTGMDEPGSVPTGVTIGRHRDSPRETHIVRITS